MKHKEIEFKGMNYGILIISIIFIFSFCTAAQVPGSNCSSIDCDDRNICTKDSCEGNSCVHTPMNCDDGLEDGTLALPIHVQPKDAFMHR